MKSSPETILFGAFMGIFIDWILITIIKFSRLPYIGYNWSVTLSSRDCIFLMSIKLIHLQQYWRSRPLAFSTNRNYPINYTRLATLVLLFPTISLSFDVCADNIQFSHNQLFQRWLYNIPMDTTIRQYNNLKNIVQRLRIGLAGKHKGGGSINPLEFWGQTTNSGGKT